MDYNCDCEENSELQIDLDYNDNINRENDEPLDLSVKNVSIVSEFSFLDQMNFDKYQHKFEDKPSDMKIPVVTERDISLLIDPFLKYVNKKVICKVCKVKCVTKDKAKTHVEQRWNKHFTDLEPKPISQKRLQKRFHL